MALFPRLRGKVKEAVQILVSPFADHKFKHWPASELDPESLKSLKESIASGRWTGRNSSLWLCWKNGRVSGRILGK